MKRTAFFRILLSALLLIGVPLIAVHAHEAQADTLQTITFKDQYLYNRMVEDLGSKVAEKDDATLEIKMTPADIASVTSICFRSDFIEDVSGLENFTHLVDIDLCANKLKNFNELSKLTWITKLNVYDNMFTDLAGLEKLTNLTYLNAGYSNDANRLGGIANLQALESLTNLTYLNFEYNWNADVAVHIGKLTNLETLILRRGSGSKVMDLSNFENLKKLKVIDLYYANVKDAKPLSQLPLLEEVVLQRDYVDDISWMMSEDGTLIWPNLRKFDLYLDQRKLNTKSLEVINKLKKMSLSGGEGALELNWADIVDTAGLPHVDKNGTKYVTYDEFGARCNGIYDDFIAMRNAHIFANTYTDETGSMCEVRATKGKTYHIFKYYEDPALIKTNVDWMGANFIIHDEEIEMYPGRNVHLFKFDNSVANDLRTIENPSFTINKNTRTIPQIQTTLNELNKLGYEQFHCRAANADKRIYLRTGSTQSNDQADWFIVDKNGKVLNDIQWDYDHLTKFEIIPVKKGPFTVKNGNFTTNALNHERQTAHRGNGKWQYTYRGLLFENSGNLEISNIRHVLSKDTLTSSSVGFVNINKCANVWLDHCYFWARKCRAQSTYDLALENSTKLTFTYMDCNDTEDPDRWGLNDSDVVKDLLYQHCTTNRIDAHQGMYNLTVEDCNIGIKGLTLTGGGELLVKDSTIYSHSLMNLRSDYGCIWDGNATFLNVTWKKAYQKVAMFAQVGFSWDDKAHTIPHDFGYTPKYPNVYIDGLTIDYSAQPKGKDFYLLCNSVDYLGQKPHTGYELYWPERIYLNRYKFVNNERPNLLAYVSYNEYDQVDEQIYNYGITDLTLSLKDKASTDVTVPCFQQDNFTTDKGVVLTLKPQGSSTNTLTVLKGNEVLVDSEALGEEALAKEFTNAGTYTVKIDTVDKLYPELNKGHVEYRFTIAPKQVTPTIALSATTYTYNGNVQKPSVTVKNGANTLGSSDYNVAYSNASSTNVGTYNVTVTLKGNYKGSAKVSYTIVPKQVTGVKATAGKKSFTAKWVKATSAWATGYQVRYSLKSNMKSAKTTTVKKVGTTKATVKKLKAKKTYYVQVRAYKAVGKNKLYGAWSKTAKLTTKK